MIVSMKIVSYVFIWLDVMYAMLWVVMLIMTMKLLYTTINDHDV